VAFQLSPDPTVLGNVAFQLSPDPTGLGDLSFQLSPDPTGLGDLSFQLSPDPTGLGDLSGLTGKTCQVFLLTGLVSVKIKSDLSPNRSEHFYINKVNILLG